MELNEITYKSGLPIDGYGAGFFRVAGKLYEGPLLVLPNHIQSWGGYDDTGLIMQSAPDLDVLFVGTGAEINGVDPAFRKQIEDANVGVEVMNSPTACRTYNIVLSEGRRVGLALFTV